MIVESFARCLRVLCCTVFMVGCLPALSGETHDLESFRGMAWPAERDLLAAIRQAGKPSSNKPDEAIILRSMHPLNVGKQEEAYLVSARFPDRGRNFSASVFLYRPKLQRAIELNYTQSLGTRYVTGYYNDFVVLEQYGAGQGAEYFTHALVRFSGWDMQLLHKASFGNNLGSCDALAMDNEPCVQSSVQFSLLTPAKVNAVDLVEVTTKLRQVGKQTEKLSVSTRRFRLTNGRFESIKG